MTGGEVSALTTWLICRHSPGRAGTSAVQLPSGPAWVPVTRFVRSTKGLVLNTTIIASGRAPRSDTNRTVSLVRPALIAGASGGGNGSVGDAQAPMNATPMVAMERASHRCIFRFKHKPRQQRDHEVLPYAAPEHAHSANSVGIRASRDRRPRALLRSRQPHDATEIGNEWVGVGDNPERRQTW
jgi:hypothetical protein